jgi:hypothetical protein
MVHKWAVHPVSAIAGVGTKGGHGDKGGPIDGDTRGGKADRQDDTILLVPSLAIGFLAITHAGEQTGCCHT